MTDFDRDPHLPDRRSPLAVGMELATQITTIGVEMALSGLVGYWIDGKLGTGIVFLILGVFVGVAVGMLHLIRMVKGQHLN